MNEKFIPPMAKIPKYITMHHAKLLNLEDLPLQNTGNQKLNHDDLDMVETNITVNISKYVTGEYSFIS